jgi:tetratricopeptide (TPR) repeat protein
VVHLHAGEYAEAHEIFSAVAAETDPANECAYADAHRNVANTLIRLGRIDEATCLLSVIRGIDERFGRSLHVVRDDALAAVALDVAGSYDDAADAYEDVEKRFAAAGEHESALLTGISRAVVLVAASRPTEARGVLQGLLTSAVTGNSDRRHSTAEALAYLRELAEREQLTSDVASSVALYIDRIHVQRVRPFTPPMSPLTM